MKLTAPLRALSTSLTRGAPIVLALSALALAGCGKKKDKAEPVTTVTTATGEVKPASDAVNWITHNASGTKFQAPKGWKKMKGSDSIVFVSPDDRAVLAFDSYKSGTDPGASIMKLASKLNLSDLDWKGGQKDLKIGKDQLSGRGAEGTCNYKGQPATYSYATVNASDSKDILIIYAVQKNAAPEHKQEAKNSLRSLQKS